MALESHEFLKKFLVGVEQFKIKDIEEIEGLEEIQPEDVKLGILPNYLKKMFIGIGAFAEDVEEKIDLMMRTANKIPSEELALLKKTLELKIRMLKNLFWNFVQLEFPVVIKNDEIKSLSIRKNWMVVYRKESIRITPKNIDEILLLTFISDGSKMDN